MGEPNLIPQPAKVRGFMMEPSDLRDISKIMGVNVATKQDLFIYAELLTTCSVQGTDIRLEPKLQQRLRSRCYGSKPFPEFLREIVLKALTDYAGM